MAEINEQWISVLEVLKGNFSKPSFDTWLKNTNTKVDGDTWYIIAPNDFSRDWLEARYKLVIEDAIFTVTKVRPKVVIIMGHQNSNMDNSDLKLERIINQIESLPFQEREKLFLRLNKLGSNCPTLSKNYTFNNFIVHQGNRFAHAAAHSVAINPGKSYNPLFINAPIGSGKTHLLHAIGNYVLENNTSANIVYTTAEQFANEFIDGIGTNHASQFREKYRHADVLLLDDIQFLTGKESSQAEIFHIFNHLYEKSRQIVITCDCLPEEIQGLNENLLARLKWGLITEITPPEQDVNRTIMESLCDSEQTTISVDVLDFIAEKEFENIAEIQSTLKQIATYQELTQEPVEIDDLHFSK